MRADFTINIRVKQNQRDLIDRAADVQGKSRSEFMLDAAYQRATEVIIDRSSFGVDQLKFKEFLALLNALPNCNEKLSTLLTNKSPWD